VTGGLPTGETTPPKSIFEKMYPIETLDFQSREIYNILMALNDPIETTPYKPADLIEVVELPKDIIVPETQRGVVETAKHIFATGELPQQFEQLGQLLEGLYNSSYEEGRNIDVEPSVIDLLFQQYAIKKDEVLKRNRFNTFGLYGLSYLDGLATNPSESQRFVRKNPFNDRQPTALLLGCSSITSADQFCQFIKAMNPEAQVVIADIDPLACQLARESKARVIQLDAQKIALTEMSVDFIATNFLIHHLRDRLNAGKDTLANIMKEAARVLTRSGRIVMVEQLLTRAGEKWLNYYAGKADLDFARGVNLFHRDAIVLPAHQNFKWLIGAVPELIKDNLEEGLKPSEAFSGGQRLDSVCAYTFEESKRAARKGWKKGRTVRVKSSIS